MSKHFETRLGRTLLAAGLLTAALAAPAVATPEDDAGEHKVTICHVTNATNNPYVVMTVDVAAFDGGEDNDHKHHMAKDGRIDVTLESVGGVCPDVGGPTD